MELDNGKGNVGVIHFDAHYGATQMMGHLITHGEWVKRLFVEGHVPGKNFIRVALRGYYPDKDSFEWMRKVGFRYHPMAEVERRGWDAVMEDVIKEDKDGPEYLYISFDIDTLDPAFVPGTGTPARWLQAGLRWGILSAFGSMVVENRAMRAEGCHKPHMDITDAAKSVRFTY